MKYFLVGIKGTGMSALAQCLKDLGELVIGSDKDDHYFTEVNLKKNKNTIFIHIPELKNIKDLDKLIKLISNINITTCI